MERPGSEASARFDPEWRAKVLPLGGSEVVETATDTEANSLETLVGDLGRDPEECRRAFLGLQSLDVDARLSIIEGLTELSFGTGVRCLLELLSAESDPTTSQAALSAIAKLDRLEPQSELTEFPSDPASHTETFRATVPQRIGGRAEDSAAITRAGDGSHLLLADSLVTAVDGDGKGAIGISVCRDSRRITALFLCQVERGLLDAEGQIEEESLEAGELLRSFRAQANVPLISDVEELALGLLAGELMLNNPRIPRPVGRWLDEALGTRVQPRAFAVEGLSDDVETPGPGELLLRAEELLESCPTWLDSSELTFELAEEIVLREGRANADSQRDSGAFRFLFEHRFLDRLERYRRMLLWMSRFWEFGGQPNLARSAQIFAEQLSDEQNAVPAHPFIVVLTTRSLDAAQDQIGTSSDPRAVRRGL
jgi:hypothetical protein